MMCHHRSRRRALEARPVVASLERRQGSFCLLGHTSRMERVELTVRGENASSVPEAIRGVPRDKRTDYAGDGFAVVVTEEYFFRTNAQLQTTVIFELVGDDACEVTVVAGGGGSGWAQQDLNAESRAAENVVEKVEEYCEENGLEIER